VTGQSNWYKGIQLTTVYAIIALMSYLIPEVVTLSYSSNLKRDQEAMKKNIN